MFYVDTELEDELVYNALKSSKTHDSPQDALLLFEVFCVNQEHDTSKPFPAQIKKRLQRIPNWFEMVLDHHFALMKSKGRNLNDVFALLSLDKDLLDEIYPKLSEHDQLTSFVKEQKMKYRDV